MQAGAMEPTVTSVLTAAPNCINLNSSGTHPTCRMHFNRGRWAWGATWAESLPDRQQHVRGQGSSQASAPYQSSVKALPTHFPTDSGLRQHRPPLNTVPWQSQSVSHKTTSRAFSQSPRAISVTSEQTQSSPLLPPLPAQCSCQEYCIEQEQVPTQWYTVGTPSLLQACILSFLRLLCVQLCFEATPEVLNPIFMLRNHSDRI